MTPGDGPPPPPPPGPPPPGPLPPGPPPPGPPSPPDSPVEWVTETSSEFFDSVLDIMRQSDARKRAERKAAADAEIRNDAFDGSDKLEITKKS